MYTAACKCLFQLWIFKEVSLAGNGLFPGGSSHTVTYCPGALLGLKCWSYFVGMQQLNLFLSYHILKHGYVKPDLTHTLPVPVPAFKLNCYWILLDRNEAQFCFESICRGLFVLLLNSFCLFVFSAAIFTACKVVCSPLQKQGLQVLTDPCCLHQLMQNSGASFISCLQMKTDLPILKKLRSSHIKYCMLESPRDYRIYRGTEEQCILVLFSYFSPLCLACLSCKFGRKRWSSLVVRKQCQQPR